MNRAISGIFNLLVLSALALPGAASAGPVLLMGIDGEDGNPPGHGGITPYQTLVDSLLGDVTNGGNGLLVIGGGKDPVDDVTNFWTLVEAAGIAQPVTFVNSAAAITAQDFAGFAAIAVVSDVSNTPSGGLTNDENNALSARSGDVANFVNAGGGLFGLSSEGVDAPYGYVAGLGGFTFTDSPNYDNVTATAAGLLSGFTDTNLDVDAWHNTFVTFPSFLNVLATVGVCDLASGGSGVYVCDDIVGNAAAIGGVSVQILVTEPSSVALIALGLVGIGWRRRRREVRS